MAKTRRRLRPTDEGKPDSPRRALGPESITYSFVSGDDLQINVRHATSPWRPVIAEFVKSGFEAVEFEVGTKQEGRNLVNRLRDVCSQMYPEKDGWLFGTSNVRRPGTAETEGKDQYFAYLVLRERPVDTSEEE